MISVFSWIYEELCFVHHLAFYVINERTTSFSSFLKMKQELKSLSGLTIIFPHWVSNFSKNCVKHIPSLPHLLDILNLSYIQFSYIHGLFEVSILLLWHIPCVFKYFQNNFVAVM